MTAKPELTLPGHLALAVTADGPILHFRHDQYVGRSLSFYGEYCAAEGTLLARFSPSGGVVVEAGANIGAHTVGLARAVGPGGRVHAFEPQRVVHQLLCANLTLNGILNTETHHAGVGAATGTLRVPEPDYTQAGNFGGFGLSGDPAVGTSVRVLTVDSLALPRLDLLKADVEGMEAAVLAGAEDTIRRCRPVLYVENDRDDQSPALLRQMLGYGYRLWWHKPFLFSPDNPRGVAENIFPGTIAINVLGLPRESGAGMEGLREITDESSHWRG